MSGSEQMSALVGGRAETQQSEDYKAKYEEAMRQLNSAKVEQGRVAKLDSEKKELERRLAELQQGKSIERIRGSLSEQERENISDDFVTASAKMAMTAADGAIAGVKEEVARIHQEREEEKAANRRRMEREFQSAIDSRYPDFLANIQNGCKWHAAWSSFLMKNSGSVREAFAALDAAALSYHVDRFYREELDVIPDRGREDASAPDPVAKSGGTPGFAYNKERVYTSEEYSALEEKAMKLRREGRFEEYKRLDDELANILAEGRVRD